MGTEETVVRSNCPVCGTVDLPADAVTVFVTADHTGPRYRYTCPSCYGIVEKPTTPRAVPMLRTAGARIVCVPAEPAPETSGQLDLADLAAFSRALAQVDDLARAAAQQH